MVQLERVCTEIQQETNGFAAQTFGSVHESSYSTGALAGHELPSWLYDLPIRYFLANLLFVPIIDQLHGKLDAQRISVDRRVM